MWVEIGWELELDLVLDRTAVAGSGVGFEFGCGHVVMRGVIHQESADVPNLCIRGGVYGEILSGSIPDEVQYAGGH
jgi:hypothetical protein